VDNLLQNTNLSFIDRMMRLPLPKKFKVPHIERYSGDGDLTDNMESYRAHLVLHDTPDEITRWALRLTLKANDRNWFEKFPPKFMDNFEFLER
jgi:hypothetical protein